MGKIMSLPKNEGEIKKEVARIMREETFYSICPKDVKVKNFTEESSTYSAKIRVASENGNHINLVEIICIIYPCEGCYKIKVNK